MTRKQNKIPNKVNILLTKVTYLITLLFLLQGCSPFPSTSPQLQFATAIQSLDPVNDKQTPIKTEIALAITGFKLSDNTDLGPSFSKLYLASLTNGSHQSTDYLSIADVMHGKNSNEMVIRLDQNALDNLETIDICLVSGQLDDNKLLHIKNKWKCKSFDLNELLQIENNEHDFALEDQSAKTPHVALSLNQHTE